MATMVVDEAILDEIVRRLVDKLQPGKIILFGSRARGNQRPDSDVDLLIIKPSSESPHRRLRPAYQALWGIRVPIDILWYTPEEVADWSTISGHVVTRAAREGRILYEQDEPASRTSAPVESR
jgi:predicted nucleotidyltransferase